MDEVGNESSTAGATAGCAVGKIVVSDKDEANSIEDNTREDDDSEADESVGKGFFAICGFAGIARGEHIEVATVYNIAKD